MMIRNRTLIVVEVKGREYNFECAPDSPLDEAAAAVELMKNYIQERMQAAVKPVVEEPTLPIEEQSV
jgi:hypothetical protein